MKTREAFRHLNEHDRDHIHVLYGYGHTKKEIADVLGVHKSTVTRELARYGRKTWRYSAAKAQEDADEKRTRSKRPGMKIAEDPALRRYVIGQLKKLRSPDEIAGRMWREGRHPRVGTGAIYKWLYSKDGKRTSVSLHSSNSQEEAEQARYAGVDTRPDVLQRQAR